MCNYINYVCVQQFYALEWIMCVHDVCVCDKLEYLFTYYNTYLNCLSTNMLNVGKNKLMFAVRWNRCAKNSYSKWNIAPQELLPIPRSGLCGEIITFSEKKQDKNQSLTMLRFAHEIVLSELNSPIVVLPHRIPRLILLVKCQSPVRCFNNIEKKEKKSKKKKNNKSITSTSFCWTIYSVTLLYHLRSTLQVTQKRWVVSSHLSDLFVQQQILQLIPTQLRVLERRRDNCEVFRVILGRKNVNCFLLLVGYHWIIFGKCDNDFTIKSCVSCKFSQPTLGFLVTLPWAPMATSNFSKHGGGRSAQWLGGDGCWFARHSCSWSNTGQARPKSVAR